MEFIENQILIGVGVILIILCLLTTKREKFEQGDEKSAKMIAQNITPGMSYENYLNMISQTDSLSYKIVEQSAFFYLKKLSEKGTLTTEDVLKEM